MARPRREPVRDLSGLPARRLAYAAIEEVLRRSAPLDDVFDRLAAEAGLEDRDEGLARAIAVVAFRRHGTIRRALSDRLQEGLRDGRLGALMTAGAAQILFLNVPDHAAVDLSVELARAERLKPFAGLVNAVLRRIAREREAILSASDPLATDTPDWLARRWRAHYADAAAAIAAAHREGAALDVTAKEDSSGWAARLGGTLLPTGSIRLAARTAVRDLPGYEEGAWWVQDAAAALPARLLAPQPGERVADLCAAPGGKTAQLAAAGAAVLAVDRSEPRLRRLSENMARLKLTVEAKAADVLTLAEEPFDAVLLDAPCSATGTIRRHPDVPWTKRQGDLDKLAGLQARLLDKAAALTRPGGRLVFCTCSLEPEEGEAQAAAFLERHPDFARVPIEPAEVGGLAEAVTPEGDLRTLPHQRLGESAGLDGFFAARFRRGM
ncbi:MAG TPA: transcription antitermination factor NusB [Beijerinckiaceae bacterium]|nr:transcription antitermination factor NusB [Beijerinckiaceae bacterium]